MIGLLRMAPIRNDFIDIIHLFKYISNMGT